MSPATRRAARAARPPPPPGVHRRAPLPKLRRLAQTLWATTVVCCWTMWAAVYLAQMHPLVRPVLTG